MIDFGDKGACRYTLPLRSRAPPGSSRPRRRRVAARCMRPTAQEASPREAHLSAQQSQAKAQAWLPAAHAQPRWSRGCEEPARQGPPPALGVIWRVRGRAEFAALSRARRHARGPLSVRVRAATVESVGQPPRVAFAVGRSVGPAVARNRVRRRLREALRQSPEL